MEHLQQLKDFDENLAYEKEARAQEMEQRRRVEVFHFNAYLVCPTLFFVLAFSFRVTFNVPIALKISIYGATSKTMTVHDVH